MKLHEFDLHGRLIRYFDAYDSDHLAIFSQSHRENRTCIAVGPTGVGKTTFFDFACASLFSSDARNITVYARRYGHGDGPSSVARALNIAESLRSGELLSIAFYPKPAEIAQLTGSDTWPETLNAVDHVLSGLTERGLLQRLAGLEFSVEPGYADIYNEIRLFATERDWCLLKFGAWDAITKLAYANALLGIDTSS